MRRSIAVYVGENGETTSLFNQGRLVVYQKKKGKWSSMKEMDFSPDGSRGIKELRKKMEEVLEFLGNCRVIVGLSITGVPYYELEKCRFSVWEFEGRPLEFLDYVLEKEEEKQSLEDAEQNACLRFIPIETSSGNYQISIKEIQEKDIGLTTKQVLLPVLRKGNFNSLEVICSHVPPWLEAGLLSNCYCGEIKKNNNDVRVILTGRVIPS
ncbi:MAG: Iron only nitrogenase protein AnfO (AnfO_nitrog) [Pelotomaculum sp. PtaU1.Bin035]|nr:MAG: Iron only nitrogenase protein AnfO (AnfO_nitrog) [Pelotomaculum sp. PtaU1.Bin035]